MKAFEPLIPIRLERWGAVAAMAVVAASLAAAWSTAGPGSWVPARTLAAVRGEIPVVRLEPVVVVARRDAVAAGDANGRPGDASVACATGTRHPG